jgi:hypothetical protein
LGVWRSVGKLETPRIAVEEHANRVAQHEANQSKLAESFFGELFP